MGMAGKEGAIDRVAVQEGALCSHVIGGGKAAGVCGSGVVDAMSAFLELGLMDETGCLTKDPVLSQSGYPFLSGMCAWCS